MPKVQNRPKKSASAVLTTEADWSKMSSSSQTAEFSALKVSYANN